MTPNIEKRLLQAAVSIACLIPLSMGGESLLRGPAVLRGVTAISPDLDSHFRYVSGIFFAVGVAFVTCIADIERKSERFRLLGCLVVAGGLGRLLSLLLIGPPSRGHLFGLCMELGVVPLLMLWQARVARRGA